MPFLVSRIKKAQEAKKQLDTTSRHILMTDHMINVGVTSCQPFAYCTPELVP